MILSGEMILLLSSGKSLQATLARYFCYGIIAQKKLWCRTAALKAAKTGFNSVDFPATVGTDRAVIFPIGEQVKGVVQAIPAPSVRN